MRTFLFIPFLLSTAVCGHFRCSTDTATDTGPDQKSPAKGRATKKEQNDFDLGTGKGSVGKGRRGAGARTGRAGNLRDVAKEPRPCALIRMRTGPRSFPSAGRATESSTATSSLNRKAPFPI